MASLLLLRSKHGTCGGTATGSSNNAISVYSSDHSDWSTTATVGIGLVVFLYLTGKYTNSDSDTETARNFCKRNVSRDEYEYPNRINSMQKVVDVIYTFCRTIADTVLESLISYSSRRVNDDVLLRSRLRALEKAKVVKEKARKDAILPYHEGSCQCHAIQYRIRAPRKLHVVDERKINLASIQYPHVKIPVDDFDLVTGASHMQSFQKSTEYEIVAHTFCARCGVHLLHATKSSSYLFLNALTLKKDDFSPENARENNEFDSYSFVRKLQKSYLEPETEILTNITSRSTSSDESIDLPFTGSNNSTCPPSPILMHPSHHEEVKTRNQIHINDIGCSLKDYKQGQYDNPFEIRSTGAMFHQNVEIGHHSAVKYGAPLDDDDADCISLRSAPCQPPNGTIISCRRRSISRTHYALNGGLAEMDAQSVASSISDNLYSNSYGLDSASVYSRSSSLRSLPSSDHSHFQLRKYLAKHITPRESLPDQSFSSPASVFGENTLEQNSMKQSPKLPETCVDHLEDLTPSKTSLEHELQLDVNEELQLDVNEELQLDVNEDDGIDA